MKPCGPFNHMRLRESFISTQHINAQGYYHCDSGPAVILENGDREYYINGLLHREDGPACEYERYREWYINGELHRVGKPAVEWNDGSQYWYLNGKLHREDGPAIFLRDHKIERWYYNGTEVNCASLMEFKRYVEKLIVLL